MDEEEALAAESQQRQLTDEDGDKSYLQTTDQCAAPLNDANDNDNEK